MPDAMNSALEALQARWDQQGAAIADALAPGLAEDEIDALIAPLGLELPQQARAWWRWHDGTRASPGSPAAEIGPELVFLPLADAVAACQRYRADYAGWHRDWLPVARGDRGPRAIDCATGRVRRVEWELLTARVVADSISDMVNYWCAMLDARAWEWDAAGGCWNWHYDRLPPETVELHAVW